MSFKPKTIAQANKSIANLYNESDIGALETTHAERIRKYFQNNLSNVGRYSLKDFERFGNLVPQTAMGVARQDGWVALTEEAPHINHLTFGTGILYIHGEMEIASYEKDEGGKNLIQGDEFNAVSKTDEQHFIDPYVQPYFLPSIYFDTIAQGVEWDWVEGPEIGPQGTDYYYNAMIFEVGGVELPAENVILTEPTGENDAEIYYLNNERNNFPWVILNSGAPESVGNLLEELENTNGMYDGLLPAIAIRTGTFPPVVTGGIKYVGGGIKSIKDFISPLDLK
jgi:hypothetical protein